MDIDKLEILIRAVELGSLSKAANEFSYTPSAVSHILDVLEEEIGIRFIKRTYSGIRVENGCEDIVDNIRRIVDIQKETKQLALRKQQKKSVLTVATYASVSKYILAKVIKGFNKIMPDIHINVLVADDIEKAFQEGRADIIVGEQINERNLCWEELITDPYVAVFPKQYKFKKRSVAKDELYGYPFIKASDGKITTYIDENKFLDVISVNSHDDSSVIHMVKEGLGVAILPMLSLYEEKNVNCLKLRPDLVRNLGLAYNTMDFNTKTGLGSFVEYIRNFDFKQFGKK